MGGNRVASFGENDVRLAVPWVDEDKDRADPWGCLDSSLP